VSALAIYLAGGVLTLALVLGVHRMSSIRFDRFRLDDPESPSTRWSRVIEGVVLPIMAGGAVIAFWPLVLVVQARDLPAAWRRWRRRERPFRIRRRYLRNVYTRAEVEAREFVHDPLGGVPALPFGHLNAAWCRFADALPPETKFRAFKAPPDAHSYPPTQQEGYVAIGRLGRVGAYFVASRVELGDP
jgi:hypothetical protein